MPETEEVSQSAKYEYDSDYSADDSIPALVVISALGIRQMRRP